jgi:hypothetical protein
MTSGNQNKPGAFRKIDSPDSEGYENCQVCNGLYFYEQAGDLRRRPGFGSSTGVQAPRAPVFSETQRLINAKRAQDRVLVQNHLRFQFLDPTTRCNCNPENDLLYLEVRLKETFAKIPKPKDVSADLKILDDLLSRGVLTHDQHDAARRKLLT